MIDRLKIWSINKPCVTHVDDLFHKLTICCICYLLIVLIGYVMQILETCLISYTYILEVGSVLHDLKNIVI